MIRMGDGVRDPAKAYAVIENESSANAIIENYFVSEKNCSGNEKPVSKVSELDECFNLIII